MRHADLLVVPSRREGFGNVLLEGLALGTPAVAADCPGAIREIYGDHPAVHLVPAEDPAALAATIIEKCRMLARAPTKSAAAAAWRAKFAVQKSADEYGAMLTGRISEQRRSG